MEGGGIWDLIWGVVIINLRIILLLVWIFRDRRFDSYLEFRLY